MSLLLLVLLALPGLAQATCSTMSVPDGYTTPTATPMASGGTITIDAGTRCDPFGLNPYPSGGTTLPSHGTVTVVSYSGTITYTNNGDGATSDSFVVADASAHLFTVNVAISAATSPVTVSPISLPTPQVGTAYSQTLSATGGIAPYSYTVTSGSLPPGLTLSGATISGTPIQAGPYSVSITVTDNVGTTSAKSYTVVVPNPSPGIAIAAPPTAFLNASYNQTLSASGALAPYTFALNGGSLPPGISLASNGILSGTPTSTGTYNFAVVATDSSPNLGGSSPGPYFKVVNLSLTVQNVPPTAGSVSAAIAYNSSNNPITLNITGAPATSVAVATAAIHGTATASGTSITYTPTIGYAGPDSFTYTATNSAGTSAPATVSITVNNAPSPCVAIFWMSGVHAGYAVTGSIFTFTYNDAQNTVFQAAPKSTGTIDRNSTFVSSDNGIASVNAAGILAINGVGTTTITATTSGGCVATATVVVNAPALPTAAPKSATTPYNTAVSIDLSSSITGLDITAVTIGTAPTHGTVSVSGKTVTYTPSPTYYGGPDSFTYTATNPGGTSAPATVSITVGRPGAPTVVAKSVTTAYSTAVAIDLTSSITGVDITAVTIASAPAHGTVSVSGKTVTYTPSSSYYGGNDSFTYTATNPGGTSAPATVSITVGTPTAPTAAAKSVTTAYNTAVAIDLSSSITGVDITAVTIGSAPVHGTASVSGKTVTYTPSSGYYGGTDSFTYSATNPGGTSAPATVSITIGIPGAPTAAAKSVATAYNTPVTINLSGLITGVDVTAVTIGSAPAHGTASVSGETVTYTPSSTYYGGSDSFTYTATNPGGTSAPATVSITVGLPAAPTVAAKSVSTAYNTAASINLTSSITGVDVTAVTIGTAPVHGTVSVSGKTATYTPSSTYYGGADSFTYTATNPGGTSAPATVSITVGLPAAPTGAAKSVSTAYNTAAAIDLSGSITGVDITAVTIGTMPAHGTLSVSGRTVTYTPSSTYYGGSDSFTYTATNPGGTSAPATVSITVGLPAAPTVTARNVTTVYNTAASIDLSAAIAGVDITAVAIASAPSHGTVSVSGKTVTYTPSPTFYGGSDSFTYTATNPGGTSAPATVTMTVTPLNVPTAQALSVTTTTGTSVQIQATAGATGPTPFIGASVATAPAHGQATASGEQITYTPTAGFIGTDHFTYQIANHFGASAAATVTVAVTAAGQASAPNGTVTLTTKPGEPVSTNLGNIVTGPFVSATVLGLSPSGAGQVSISQPTTLTFTSVASFQGLAQITAVLTAADGHTATVDVLVLVSNQPDPSKNPDVLGLINAQTMEAQRFADSQLGNIQQRLESVRDGNDRLFNSTLSLNQDGRSPQASGAATTGNRLGRPASSDSNPYDPNGVAATARPGPGAEGATRMMQSPDASGATSAPAAVQDEADHAAPSRGSNGLGTWIDVSADFGSFDAYRQAAGFDADDIAISTGIDRRLGEYGLLGLSLGYNHDRSAIGNDGTRSTARGYSAALYSSFAPSAKTYIDAILGGGGLSFDSRRRASNSDSYLFGQRDGKQWFGSVTTGYEYRHAHWLLSPYGRLQWSYSNLDGFAESGDVIDALAYGRQSVRTTVAVLGLRTSWMVVKDQTIFTPRVRLEVGHNFQGTSDTTLNYAFIPSAGSWSVLTNPYSANGNSVLAGLGLDIQLPRGMTLTTDYNFLMQPHSHNQLIRLGVQTKF